MLWLLLPTALAFEPAIGVDVQHLATSVDDPVDAQPGYGGHLRLRFDDWAVEAAAASYSATYDPRIGLVRFLGDSAPYVRPFASASAGALVTKTDTTWLAEVGFGLDIEMSRYVDLRSDARYRRMGGFEDGAFVFGLGLQLHTPREHDSDHDGLPDPVDACVTEAEDADGFEDTDGCPDPDNDADAIPDEEDACPDEAEDEDGHADTDGCPDPDNDADGLVDAADMCRDVAEDPDGFADADGCPDLDDDSDRIPDAEDTCPYDPETANGYQDGDGCPDWLPDDLASFTGRLDGISFKPGSAELLPSSRWILDNAVDILAAYPDVAIEVQGHTDDRGEDEVNLELSQARAESVVAALVEGGIAPERLVAKGYGEARPVVPNTTEMNRARNRRVEIHLVDFDPEAEPVRPPPRDPLPIEGDPLELPEDVPDGRDRD